ncbi:MAG: substrate-binding domain-containing protein [Hyphomicrobiales bacterium]|nr:substrate-binding domain-containing protein [Hyphomicrobiales bacterium]MBV9910439.1 substrate-binding domain-containing protein [Hyphomicrobiales bacterium]
MDGFPHRVSSFIFAATWGLAAVLSSLAALAADPSIALILGVKGSPFDDALACGALEAAKKLGLHVDLFAPDHFTGESQAPVVDAVTARSPTIAIISPADANGVTRPLKQMADRAAKIITVDTVVADPSFVASEVITSNIDGGKTAAAAMIEAIGGKGPVLVITNPPGSVAQDERAKGFEEGLKSASGVTYLGPQYQNDDPQKAAEIVTSTLAAHPDLAGIFSTNDQGAIGAITGLRQAGGIGRVKLVAYDSAAAEVNAFKNNQISVLIAQDPKREGEMSVEIAKKILDGQSVEKQVLADTVPVMSGDTAKADRYEYKSDCSLSY